MNCATVKHRIAAAGLLLAGWLASVPAPALADATVKADTSGKGLGQLSQGQTVTYIKGARMRTDVVLPKGEMQTTILDVESGKMIVLNHKKKQAEVSDLSGVSAALREISDSDVRAEMKPTGRSQQMLGETCDEYDVAIRIKFSPVPNEPIDMVMSGPVWIAKSSAVREDYSRFYLAAAEKGLFFGDPKVAKAQPGQAKGFTTLYKKMAEAGVPYSMDVQFKFEGSGLMAALMGKLGASITHRVTAVSDESLSDDLFEVPAGYKVKGP